MTTATLTRAAAAAFCTLALAAAGCGRPAAGSTPTADGAGVLGAGGLGTASATQPAAAGGQPSAQSRTPQPGSGPAGPTAPTGPTGPTGRPEPSASTASGPQIVYLRITQKPQCPQGTNQFPVPGVPLVIEWKVTGAHQVALSVDNPGMVGSYGTYGLEAGETFMFSCGGAPNTVEKHSYTIYTVGGGEQRHRTLTAEATVYEIGQT